MENQNQKPDQQMINIQVPTVGNIANKRSLIPILFTIVIVFFFFNFFTISCGEQKVGSVSGINLVTGTELKKHDMFSGKETKGEEIPSSIWAIIAFSAAIVGLGVFLIKEKREALIGTGAGAIGFGSLIILQFAIKSAIEEKGEGAIHVDYEFAYWGALIAIGIATYVSYLRLQKGKGVTMKATPQASNEQPASPQQQVETGPNPVQQENSFDTSEWLKKNKVIVAGLLIAGIAGYGLYYFVLRNDPTSDGKKVAIEQCDCQEGYLRAQINALQDFNNKFDTYKFKNRQAAKTIIDSILVPSLSIKKNLEKTNLRYKQLSEKFAIDKDQKEKFDYAFNAQKELCKHEKQEQLLKELYLLAIGKINTIIGLTEKIDRILAQQYGNRYRVLTDSNSNFEKYEMDQFIKPERKNNEYYPYIVNGDFNGDGFLDYAALVQDRQERQYLLSRLAIVWGNDNSIAINDDACSAISLFKGNRTIQGMEDAPVSIKNDAIEVVCFEKSSWVLYWDGASFERIWTSD